MISTGLELLDRSIDVDDAILHAVGLVLGWTFVRVLALPFEPRLRDRD